MALRDIYVSGTIRLGNPFNVSSTISATSSLYSDTFTLNAANNLYVNTVNNKITYFGGNVLPNSNNLRNFGSYGYAWADFYASGTLRVGDSSNRLLSLTANAFNSSAGLSLNTTNFQTITFGGDIMASSSNNMNIGSLLNPMRAIYARASSTVPRSFAAGQATQAFVSGETNQTITHNLGIVPSWIKIWASLGEVNAGTDSASSTSSYGAWLNGVGPTETPGANSSTYAQSLRFQVNGLNPQSSTNTIRITHPNSTTALRVLGTVFDVTSTTFRVNYSYMNFNNGGDLNLQWEAGY